jgi:hypothetical protein
MRISLESSLRSGFGGGGLGNVGELIFVRLTGHRVGATGMKRMAAANALQAKPQTARGAMNFNRFTHIVGAGRVIPARRRQKWRDQTLIPGEEEE